jgi:esterase/lipase
VEIYNKYEDFSQDELEEMIAELEATKQRGKDRERIIAEIKAEIEKIKNTYFISDEENEARCNEACAIEAY